MKHGAKKRSNTRKILNNDNVKADMKSNCSLTQSKILGNWVASWHSEQRRTQYCVTTCRRHQCWNLLLTLSGHCKQKNKNSARNNEAATSLVLSKVLKL